MSGIVVFLGPTLPTDRARQELEADYRPPASQGDVYRAARAGAEVIAIVDGHFDHVPAVWHKEILWAMSRGVHVYGSASMGALRAAELCDFGMVGAGRVFRSYRDGVLHDDDEVAIVHGPPETGYRPASEAMVNIRATLGAAEAAGVIGAAAHAALERAAKELYFPLRTYPAMLERAGGQISATEAESFAGWWRQGHVDVKRSDALEMLTAIRDGCATRAAKRVTFAFEHTLYWQHLVDSVEGRATEDRSLASRYVLDELWLLPETCVAVHREALLKHILVEAGCEATRPADVAGEYEARFRTDGFASDTDLARWLTDNDLTPADLGRLLGEEAVVGDAIRRFAAYRGRLAAQLRLTGLYEVLAERARVKRAVLSDAGWAERTEPSEHEEAEALFGWQLAHMEKKPAPWRAAFLALARSYWPDFVRAIANERAFQQLQVDLGPR